MTAVPSPATGLVHRLPPDVARGAAEIRDAWARERGTERLVAGDATLWTGGDEGRWLGWLRLPTTSAAHADAWTSFGAEVAAEGTTHVVVLGMGGSSLCPEVLRTTFAPRPGFPALLVCDSTDPAQIAAIEAAVRLPTTLFVVSSKSGGTLEPNAFLAYFHERVRAAVGGARAGARFVAITDPGSSLEAVAREKAFRRVFLGEPSVGGRFSALSAFGLVPAALLGVDVRGLLARAARLAAACAPGASAAADPGVELGAILGACARAGRDKITIHPSAGLPRLGAWLEQLLAESTGKRGTGVIPVDGEPLAAPSAYGNDRAFVRVALAGDADPDADARLDALAEAGHPVVRLRLRDALDVGAEMLRFELATAVLGHVLGIHPFDQPDVEAAKVATRRLTDAVERDGRLPPEDAARLTEGALELHADAANATAIGARPGAPRTLAAALAAHLARVRAGDYVALLAYLPMSDATEAALRRLQGLVRDRTRAATTVGFGPRFLHSTGQVHKGGPATGVFVELTCDDATDLPIPGGRLTFGVVKAAQARGDLDVLEGRGRRVVRVHLRGDVLAGLDAFERALRAGASAVPARRDAR